MCSEKVGKYPKDIRLWGTILKIPKISEIRRDHLEITQNISDNEGTDEKYPGYLSK